MTAPPSPRSPAVPGEPVADPAEWTGDEMAARDDWAHEFTAAELEDLLAMARALGARIGGDPNGLLPLTPEDFDLGRAAPLIAGVAHELKDGRGFVLLRGLPVAELDPLDAAIAYWGLGRHLGRPLSNNPAGDMIGHVTDMGGDIADPNQRPYQTSAGLDFHQDQSDLVGLLCVRTARTGGASRIASSVAVHNELARRRPDMARVLAEPFCFTRHGELGTGEEAWYRAPVFNYADGYLSVTAGRAHIDKGHKLPGAPAMTPAQDDALALLEDIAAEFMLEMDFRPGDIQLLNNHVVLHNRTGYEDWPEPGRKRMLWRLWLSAPHIRPRTPWFTTWADGVRVPGTVERVVLARAAAAPR